jgi:hypothetical protein
MKISINTLERTLPDNTVLIAHWTATLKKDGYTASTYGAQTFTRTDESPAFVPFEDLTEEMVIGWLDIRAEAKENLRAQIAEQATPTTAQSVPW